jgi:aspartyl-tRNA(Asn)/glutamyl-tRNA(Gln) amidotransferase subunit B
MEEDTGKLIHQLATNDQRPTTTDHNVSLIDFNRSGVPLVEIVTEPDFNNAIEVKEYLQKLQQIVRYLDVSDADMEKGNMRLEPNISLRETRHPELACPELAEWVSGSMHQTQKMPKQVRHDNTLPKYKVEVKNINSFRFVEKAINYEIERQQKILEKGKTPLQETRGWSEAKNATFSQRSKEEAHDYRYFPEPDIPPIIILNSQLSILNSLMPELPNKKLERFINEYALSQYDAEIITRERTTADFFETAVKDGSSHDVTPKQIANAIINKKVDIANSDPAEIVMLIKQSSQTSQISPTALTNAINEVLSENPKPVAEYKNGKLTVIMFLVGQVMRKLGGKADAKMVREKLEHALYK